MAATSRLGQVIALSCFGVVMVLPGCGNDGRLPVYPVHTKVVDAKNQPAAGALVVFHRVGDDANESAKPLGYVAEDGSLSLTTYIQGDGAPEGEYIVTVEWRPRNSNPFAAEKQLPDKLKGQYSDPAKSKIRVKIEKKPENELPTIQLQSGKSA